jgi:L-lactate dehydrogenase complex protein LldE
VSGALAYHDSCHLRRGLGEPETPRTLLSNLTGATVVPLPNHDECCGFGGSFAVRLPEISSAILGRKLKSLRESGADCLVACDAGCLMQIQGGLARAGSPLRAMHLAEVIGEPVE